MTRPLPWHSLITVNIPFTGLTVLSQTMTPLIIPLLVQQFVGEQQQGAYYGRLRLWSLMAALFVQAYAGILSDHSTSAWGRRRPFILIGSLGAALVLLGIGSIQPLHGLSGYWLLFGLAILLQVSLNISQGALQGLIPDIVPETKRGLFAGAKAFFELPIPLILVAFLIAPLIKADCIWLALGVMILIIIVTAIPVQQLRETPNTSRPSAINWKPLINLTISTVGFTGLILAAGSMMSRLGQLPTTFNSTSKLIFMGLAALLTILLTALIGVSFSVSISLGTPVSQVSSFIWWVISRLAFLIGSINIAAFAVYFLQSRLGMQGNQAAGPAGKLFLVIGILILILAIPNGILVDHIGHKRMLAICGFIAFLGAFVITLSSTLKGIYLGGVLIGLASGGFYAASWALGLMIIPPAQAGRYLGLANLAVAGAGAIGAYLGGPMADYFTTHATQSPGLGYALLVGVFGCLFLVSSFATMCIKSPLSMGRGVA